MTNFLGRSVSQALKGRKGPFFVFLAKFNVKASSQNSTLIPWCNNAGSACDELDFVGVYGHRSHYQLCRVQNNQCLYGRTEQCLLSGEAKSQRL